MFKSLESIFTELAGSCGADVIADDICASIRINGLCGKVKCIDCPFYSIKNVKTTRNYLKNK